ncbi:very short patch repair endonuclease [Agromyces cavernae]|uniref:very short patch repair endonuclease n=1 Tax=Agromyces cavernae TaxID=2898659 RepID=UPI0027DEF067|nr:very short patch repair endonuclease [Agromyces cavernae]
MATTRRPEASWASSEGVARSMRSNRRRDTSPELALRQLLHAAGCRYRVDYAPGLDRRRRADIVFTKLRIAVFVDGCFWHSCPVHGTIPKTNADYWVPKLERNRTRDEETTRLLESDGWTVLRIWEHEAADAACVRVLAVVDLKRRTMGTNQEAVAFGGTSTDVAPLRPDRGSTGHRPRMRGECGCGNSAG